jgi:hypothetical protein
VAPVLVIAKRRHEYSFPGQSGKLHRRDGSSSGRLSDWVLCVHDLTGARNVVHAREGDPLDVAYYGDFETARVHGRSVTHTGDYTVRADGCSTLLVWSDRLSV